MESSKRKTFDIDVEFKERLGLTKQGMTKRMDKWAAEYDSDMAVIAYRNPEVVSQVVGEYFPTNREFVKIVDVASGTGLVGLELNKIGFKQIDAVDPSSGMMKVAKSRNVYDKCYIEDRLDSSNTLKTNTYDCAVVVAGFSMGQLPTNALFELIRIVKPGGFIFINMMESNLVRVEEFKDRLEPLFERFTNNGVWTIVDREIKPPGDLLLIAQVLVSETTLTRLPSLLTFPDVSSN
ncbi:hypothetical protein SNE40_011951 [Patella caerulea]|uniref:Methyltransferase type 11 domain-containing protein n=1 Tax=Patella caerulea TaxID=87958 RepID=A0AAN8PKE9_PATCE